MHILNLLGDDGLSEKLLDILVSQRVARKKIENIMNGKIISPEEEQVLKQVTTETIKHENITISKDLYKDFEYKVDVDITGESIDLSQRITTLQVALQMIGSNPTITQDPVTKKIFFKLLDMGGINPKEFDTIESQQFAPLGAPVAQMGGSMSRVPQMGNPAVNKQTTAV
jgi:uncharacterized protein YlxP (DUF503 family)